MWSFYRRFNENNEIVQMHMIYEYRDGTLPQPSWCLWIVPMQYPWMTP